MRIYALLFHATVIIGFAFLNGPQSKSAGASDDPLASPRGAVVRAFLAMLNNGDAAAVRTFEEQHRSPSRLKATPMEERISRTRKLHEDWAPVEFKEFRGQTDASLSILALAANGLNLEMEFKFDGSTDKLDGVMIQGTMGVPAKAQPMTAEQRTAAVEAACRALEQGYVYPDVAGAMAKNVRAKLKAGEYDQLAEDGAFARRLTDDLRAVSHDLHLGVRVAPDEGGMHRMGLMDSGAAENYQFRKVEVLPGNIGYLRLDGFLWNDEAKRKAASAMEFLADTDAVIFDLRSNGGGEPEMIRFLTTYLFDQPTHLNDMVDRDGKIVSEFWTLKDFAGRRFKKDVPVFVLTSSRTFSGAEEFSYNLKCLKRGMLIGEKTGGGAHPVRPERLTDRLVIGVPFMRACNPITKTNWEGTGVEPDIAVPSDQALDRALEEAHTALRKGGGKS